jgi:hypothetical protein
VRSALRIIVQKKHLKSQEPVWFLLSGITSDDLPLRLRK